MTNTELHSVLTCYHGELEDICESMDQTRIAVADPIRHRTIGFCLDRVNDAKSILWRLMNSLACEITAGDPPIKRKKGDNDVD